MQNHKVVQSTYIWLFILPIVAKFLSKVESPLSFTINDEIVKLDMTLPFAWQIFYFSAVLFTIANVIYFFYCPKIIKENKNLGDFHSQQKNSSHLKNYMNEEQSSKWGEDVIDIMKNTRSKMHNFVKEKPSQILISKELDRITKNNLAERQDYFFWEIYNDANLNFKYARILALILYLVAGLMFSYILLKNMCYVIMLG